jgi:AraC-like DNA-binding protein
VRLKAVLSRLGRSYADPALSAETIAQELRVSSRYVHLLLQESGQGFGERVLELRLAAALRLLTRDPPSRVGEAAYAVGFSDLSYFNRCFRRRYGVTPTGARGRACSDR